MTGHAAVLLLQLLARAGWPPQHPHDAFGVANIGRESIEWAPAVEQPGVAQPRSQRPGRPQLGRILGAHQVEPRCRLQGTEGARRAEVGVGVSMPQLDQLCTPLDIGESSMTEFEVRLAIRTRGRRSASIRALRVRISRTRPASRPPSGQRMGSTRATQRAASSASPATGRARSRPGPPRPATTVRSTWRRRPVIGPTDRSCPPVAVQRRPRVWGPDRSGPGLG